MGYRIIDQDSDGVSSEFQNGNDANLQTKQSDKKYKCSHPGCHMMFLRPSRLERHIRSHTGERPYVCSHPGCTKSYTNSSHLKRHAETHDSIKKIYQCTQCSITASYPHNLKRHYKQMHNVDEKISCEECGKTFNKRHQLVKHQTIHFGPSFYKCDKCTKSYTNLVRFRRHQKVHEEGTKSYPCTFPGCSEVFGKLLLLCAHRKAKHIIEYKCDDCNKTFFKKTQLKIHSKIHSENRMVLQCPYDKCHRSYLFKSNLKQHVKVWHLDEKFYCNMCSMGLTSKQKLIEHIRRHYEPKRKKRPGKAQRKRRKDAGIPKKSIVTKLIGMDLPNDLEKMLMERKIAS